MTGLLFGAPDGFQLKLSSDVHERLALFAQKDAQAPEAGGVLLGREILGSRVLVVDAFSAPKPEDSRHRFWFRRAAKPHQVAIDETWRASQGRRGYLGEWHTHPEPNPSPSAIDRLDWERRLREDAVDAEFVVFLIVGTERMAVWRGSRSTGELLRLRGLGV